MKGKVSDKARLQHIPEAISEIENYIRNITFEEFSKSSEKKYFSTRVLCY